MQIRRGRGVNNLSPALRRWDASRAPATPASGSCAAPRLAL